MSASISPRARSMRTRTWPPSAPRFNSRTYPITRLPDYEKLAGYFNIDNGSGRLRGIYAENNFAAAPILKDWLSPFKSFDATTVVTQKHRRHGSCLHAGGGPAGLPVHPGSAGL